mmetsp:Transcript_150594/g.262356  ORF Transcript_150594/g.262356 Transcript_150594/m.262356 type:complete len:513 (+) Transcript_150594:109-1647(+)
MPRSHRSLTRNVEPVADDESTSHRLNHFAPFIAEFLGCMLLACVFNAVRQTGYHTLTPVTCGLTLTALTYCFGAISGAQFNPAVSFAIGLSGRGNWSMILKYWVLQVLGSMAGVTLSVIIYGQPADDPIGPREGFRSGSAFLVEFIYTGMLCLVFLNTMISRSNNSVEAGNQYFGVAIGFVLAVAGYAIGDISGAVLNPALSVALDLQNILDGGLGYGLLYTFSETMGAFVAAVAFRVLRPNEDDDYETFSMNLKSLKEAGITHVKLVAEASGTFLLVITVGLVQLSENYSTARPFGAALAMTSMHYALADVSGGYFNPAITLAVILTGRDKCSVVQGTAYIIVQFVVGNIAAWFYTAVYNGKTFPIIEADAVQRYHIRAVCAVQIIFTCAVAFTVLATSTDKGIDTKCKRNFYSGLAIGLSLCAGAFATSKLSSGAMNPAMALGVSTADLLNDDTQFWYCLYFIGSQFIGGALASVVYRATHAGVYRRHRHFGDDGDDNVESQPLQDKTNP